LKIFFRIIEWNETKFGPNSPWVIPFWNWPFTPSIIQDGHHGWLCNIWYNCRQLPKFYQSTAFDLYQKNIKSCLNKI